MRKRQTFNKPILLSECYITALLARLKNEVWGLFFDINVINPYELISLSLG